MKYLYGLFLGIILSSCYQEISLENYRQDEGENLITINSIVNPDSVVQVYATKTYFYPDGHTAPVYVDNLDIDLWINDNFIETLTCNGTIYEASVRPKEGDKIQLRTEYSGTPVSASDIIPQKVKIENVSCSVVKLDNHYRGNYKFSYEITFSDNPNEKNYYFLKFLPIGMSTLTSDLIFTEEFVFQQLKQEMNDQFPGWDIPNGMAYEGVPFSDNGIEGKTHTLHISEIPSSSMNIMPSTMMRKILLFSISEDYYKYLIDVSSVNYSDGISGGLIDIGAVEPTKIFTNIDGGIGILGSYSCDYKDVDVYQDSHFEELFGPSNGFF